MIASARANPPRATHTTTLEAKLFRTDIANLLFDGPRNGPRGAPELHGVSPAPRLSRRTACYCNEERKNWTVPRKSGRRDQSGFRELALPVPILSPRLLKASEPGAAAPEIT